MLRLQLDGGLGSCEKKASTLVDIELSNPLTLLLVEVINASRILVGNSAKLT